jgi:hypothetical protein
MLRRTTAVVVVAAADWRGRHLLRASKPLREGPVLAQGSSRGVVAGYPCFVRSALLKKHAGLYLLNDSLVIRWV